MRIQFTTLLVLLLCACIPTHAAIARSGSCSAAATSCTFSSTSTGALKFVLAIGTAGNTPTVPGTFTSLTSVSSVSGAFSYVIGCNVSSSSGDTATGTWTNASNVLGWSYTGTATGTTSNCPTTGVGGSKADSSGGSTTVKYDAITMTHSDGSSWVVGVAMGSSTTPGAPTGMSSFVTNGSSRISDTNGGVSSWSQQTVTVTSQIWASFVLEVLAPSVSGAQVGGFIPGP